MPHITHETPTQVITISESEFLVPRPYVEGHVLTASEAVALNQTFAENIRNNMAKTVKAAKDAGQFEHDAMQDSITDYALSYEFGARRGGGARTTDPVRAKLIEFMEEKVRTALKSKGHKLSDYKPSEIRSRAIQIIDNPTEGQRALVEKLSEIARSAVEDERAAGGLVLDSHQSHRSGGEGHDHHANGRGAVI